MHIGLSIELKMKKILTVHIKLNVFQDIICCEIIKMSLCNCQKNIVFFPLWVITADNAD